MKSTKIDDYFRRPVNEQTTINPCELCRALGVQESVHFSKGRNSREENEHAKMHEYQTRLIINGCKKVLTVTASALFETDSNQDQSLSAIDQSGSKISIDEKSEISKTMSLSCPIEQTLENGEVASSKSEIIDKEIDEHVVTIAFDNSIVEQKIEENIVAQAIDDRSQSIDQTTEDQSFKNRSKEQPINDRSFKNHSTKNKPIDDQVVEGQSIKNQPVDDQSIKNQLIKDKTMDGQSVKDGSIKSQPIDDQSVKNQSIKNETIDDQSVEDQSFKNQPIKGQSISVIAKNVVEKVLESDQNPIGKTDSIDHRVRLLLKYRLRNDRIRCSECGFMLKVADGNEIDVSAVIDHIGYHLAKFIFACPLCDRVACTKEAMQNHLAKHEVATNIWNVIDLTDYYKEEIFEMLERCFNQSTRQSTGGSIKINSDVVPKAHGYPFQKLQTSDTPWTLRNEVKLNHQPRRFLHEETEWKTHLSSSSSVNEQPWSSHRADPFARTEFAVSSNIGDHRGMNAIGFNDRITIDGQTYVVRFVGETAIIERSGYPHRVYFTGFPRTVLVDGYAHTMDFGQSQTILIDGQPQVIRFGAPSREFYLGSVAYSAEFGGPPILVKFNGRDHRIQLCGPPPKVNIDREPAHELLRFLRYGVQQSGSSTPLIDRNSVKRLLSEIDR